MDLDEKMQAMSDEELFGMTDKFKERLANGETLDDILVEAFAVVREADYRVLGMKPFRVQVKVKPLLLQCLHTLMHLREREFIS